MVVLVNNGGELGVGRATGGNLDYSADPGDDLK